MPVDDDGAVALERAVADAEWLAHRYDPGHDAIHFTHVPRAVHRAATFLTDDYLPPRAAPLVIRREEALAAAPPPAPIHFIFHSAYCCSTLLARAFDLPGRAMGLKEPPILNDLVGWRRRGAAPAAVARVLDAALALLARPFGPGEAVVVKPSNVANGFADVMLAMRPDASALLLHAPLPVFLGSVARKGMEGRLWVRTLLVGLVKDGLIDLGLTPEDLLGQTDLQVAAVGWLAQHALFARLIERHGPDRVRVLDSEALMAGPAAALTALAAHFRIDLDEATLAAALAGPAFNSHSKTGARFAAGDRLDEQRGGAALHAEEIERVLVWADAVAKTAGVPMRLAAPLLTGPAV